MPNTKQSKSRQSNVDEKNAHYSKIIDKLYDVIQAKPGKLSPLREVHEGLHEKIDFLHYLTTKAAKIADRNNNQSKEDIVLWALFAETDILFRYLNYLIANYDKKIHYYLRDYVFGRLITADLKFESQDCKLNYLMLLALYNVDTLNYFMASGQITTDDLNLANPDGFTTLHVGALHSGVMVRYLRAQGARADVKNNNEDTPFHIAMKSGCLDSVEHFLNDDYVNIRNKDQLLPLQVSPQALPQDYWRIGLIVAVQGNKLMPINTLLRNGWVEHYIDIIVFTQNWSLLEKFWRKIDSSNHLQKNEIQETIIRAILSTGNEGLLNKAFSLFQKNASDFEKPMHHLIACGYSSLFKKYMGEEAYTARKKQNITDFVTCCHMHELKRECTKAFIEQTDSQYQQNLLRLAITRSMFVVLRYLLSSEVGLSLSILKPTEHHPIFGLPLDEISDVMLSTLMKAYQDDFANLCPRGYAVVSLLGEHNYLEIIKSELTRDDISFLKDIMKRLMNSGERIDFTSFDAEKLLKETANAEVSKKLTELIKEIPTFASYLQDVRAKSKFGIIAMDRLEIFKTLVSVKDFNVYTYLVLAVYCGSADIAKHLSEFKPIITPDMTSNLIDNCITTKHRDDFFRLLGVTVGEASFISHELEAVLSRMVPVLINLITSNKLSVDADLLIKLIRTDLEAFCPLVSHITKLKPHLMFEKGSAVPIEICLTSKNEKFKTAIYANLEANLTMEQLINFLKYSIKAFKSLPVEPVLRLRDQSGRSILWYAVKEGKLEHVKYLDSLGAPLSETQANLTLAMMAVKEKKAKVFSYLTQSSCFNAATTTLGGDTLLHLAAQAQDQEIMTCALGLGIDIHSKNLVGNTALHLAAQTGHLATIKSLLAAEANPALKNHAGKTPVDLAVDVTSKKLLRPEYTPQPTTTATNSTANATPSEKIEHLLAKLNYKKDHDYQFEIKNNRFEITFTADVPTYLSKIKSRYTSQFGDKKTKETTKWQDASKRNKKKATLTIQCSELAFIDFLEHQGSFFQQPIPLAPVIKGLTLTSDEERLITDAITHALFEPNNLKISILRNENNKSTISVSLAEETMLKVSNENKLITDDFKKSLLKRFKQIDGTFDETADGFVITPHSEFATLTSTIKTIKSQIQNDLNDLTKKKEPEKPAIQPVNLNPSKKKGKKKSKKKNPVTNLALAQTLFTTPDVLSQKARFQEVKTVLVRIVEKTSEVRLDLVSCSKNKLFTLTVKQAPSIGIVDKKVLLRSLADIINTLAKVGSDSTAEYCSCATVNENTVQLAFTFDIATVHTFLVAQENAIVTLLKEACEKSTSKLFENHLEVPLLNENKITDSHLSSAEKPKPAKDQHKETREIFNELCNVIFKLKNKQDQLYCDHIAELEKRSSHSDPNETPEAYADRHFAYHARFVALFQKISYVAPNDSIYYQLRNIARHGFKDTSIQKLHASIEPLLQAIKLLDSASEHTIGQIQSECMSKVRAFYDQFKDETVENENVYILNQSDRKNLLRSQLESNNYSQDAIIGMIMSFHTETEKDCDNHFRRLCGEAYRQIGHPEKEALTPENDVIPYNVLVEKHTNAMRKHFGLKVVAELNKPEERSGPKP